jgi:hypothetical protein
VADLTCCSTRDGVHDAKCPTDNERQYYRCVSCGQPCVQFATSMGRCPDCRAADNHPYGYGEITEEAHRIIVTFFDPGVANARNFQDAITKINRRAQLRGYVPIEIKR